MAEEVVVAGAGFLGVNTALKLSKKGYDVTLLDKNSYHEYTPGIIDIFRDRVSEKKLKLDLEDFFKTLPVKFSQEKILDILPEKDRIETDSGAYSYDYLVLALGDNHLDPGLGIDNVETCYDLTDAKNIKNRLNMTESAVIVGTGYVGIELAGELNERGIDVEMVDRSTRPMGNSNEEVSLKTLDYLNKKDIGFKGGRTVSRLEEGRIEFENGEILEKDMVIWAGGIAASELVRNSFDTDRSGIDVNSGLSSDYPNIFGAGDCADHGHKKTAHNAMEQAETIAENIDKGKTEQLDSFSEFFPALLISMGDTAILEYGEKAYTNVFFRYLKDLVRIRYFLHVKKKKVMLKLFG